MPLQNDQPVVKSIPPKPIVRHLPSVDAADAELVPSSRAQSLKTPNDARNDRIIPTIEREEGSPEAPAKRHGVKRDDQSSTQARKRGVDESNEDLDRFPKKRSLALYINDIEALTKFYKRRFHEMTLKPLRKIVTEWVARLEPKRQLTYGRYDKEIPSKRSKPSPPWWPSDCPYWEPSHLKCAGEFQAYHLFAFAYHNVDVVSLAVDLMQVHRRIDEQCGKRKRPWISQLRTQAVYILENIPADIFASSREEEYNETSKERTLLEILPSLFDVAEAHEDYITQHKLFEGSGNTDPLDGDYVIWKRCPRLYRGLSQLEVARKVTEVDDTTSVPSPTSSLQSLASSCNDSVRVKRERSPSPPLSSVPVPDSPETVKAEPIATPQATSSQDRETSHMDAKPSGDFYPMPHPAYGMGGPTFPTSGGMGGSATYTPPLFPFPAQPSGIPFTHYPNGLPLHGAVVDYRGMNAGQPMQAPPGYPFDNSMYAPNWTMMPAPDHTMLTQYALHHGLPVAWDSEKVWDSEKYW